MRGNCRFFHSLLFFSCLSWGRESWLNEWLSYRRPFLPSVTCFLPQIATSLSLPLSPFPSLSVRIPSYLSEQGFELLWDKKTSVAGGKKKRGNKSKEQKQEGQFGNGHAVRDELIEASDFFFFRSPLGCLSKLCGACGYFRLSALQWFGMDAIMLQEKLVERLLCPRVRTARQKVKSRSFLETDKTKHQESLWDMKSQGSEVTAGGFYCASAVWCSHPLWVFILFYSWMGFLESQSSLWGTFGSSFNKLWQLIRTPAVCSACESADCKKSFAVLLNETSVFLSLCMCVRALNVHVVAQIAGRGWRLRGCTDRSVCHDSPCEGRSRNLLCRDLKREKLHMFVCSGQTCFPLNIKAYGSKKAPSAHRVIIGPEPAPGSGSARVCRHRTQTSSSISFNPSIKSCRLP